MKPSWKDDSRGNAAVYDVQIQNNILLLLFPFYCYYIKLSKWLLFKSSFLLESSKRDGVKMASSEKWSTAESYC